MKKLVWAVIVVLLTIYCVVVWGWWQEGNRNQLNTERQSSAAAYQNSIFGH